MTSNIGFDSISGLLGFGHADGSIKVMQIGIRNSSSTRKEMSLIGAHN
jgi:hypothetical protein